MKGKNQKKSVLEQNFSQKLLKPKIIMYQNNIVLEK